MKGKIMFEDKIKELLINKHKDDNQYFMFENYSNSLSDCTCNIEDLITFLTDILCDYTIFNKKCDIELEISKNLKEMDNYKILKILYVDEDKIETIDISEAVEELKKDYKFGLDLYQSNNINNLLMVIN